MMIKKQYNQGFTIIELMIAMAVFSVILLVITLGIVQVGKTYYKGTLQARTQDTARNIIDEVSRGIQFSGEDVKPVSLYSGGGYPTAGSKYGFCINGTAYAFVLDRQLIASSPNADQSTKTLISYPQPCAGFTPVDVNSASGKELLGVGMRLTDLNIVDNGNGTYTLTVGVASGEQDLFEDDFHNIDGFTPGTDGVHDTCKPGTASQFCATARLTTTIQKRIQ